MMPCSEVEIANLTYRCGECIDAGDLASELAMFAQATIETGTGEVIPRDVLPHWRKGILLYEDGTPRTRHVITNLIIDVDEVADTATSRSRYTVMQQAGDSPLQAVICGRYYDSFERREGQWRFSRRDYSQTDLIGDLSRHAPGFGDRATQPANM
jgi:hypothetical protein